MAVQKIKGDFERVVLQADGPVVVEFMATWCGYCRRLAPVIDRLEEACGGKLRVVQVDIDENEALSDSYQVELVPSLILFRDGKPSELLVNPGTQEKIEAWLKENKAL